MKKIFLILSIFILNFQISFATCTIANGEAASLGEYFSTTNKALQLLTKNIQTSENTSSFMFPDSDNAVVNTFTSEGNRYANSLVVAYNRAFDWDYFFSDFRFQLELPKQSEIPQEVKRDYELIQNYHKTITGYYNALLKSGKKDTKITKFCANFDESIRCDMIPDTATADDIMSLILQNHTRLKYNFEQIIAGNQTTELEGTNFTRVNFAKDMLSAYGNKSIESCNFADNSFGASIRKRTSKIAQLEQDNKNAIAEWKNAWKLLTGNTDTESYRELERKILQKELARQGVSADNQTIMLNNLETFNQSGFSHGNNPITNTFHTLQRKVNNEIHKFTRETLSDFLQEKEEASVSQTMSINKRANEKKVLTEELQTLYTNLEQYAASTNTTASNFQSQLIDSHIEISQSINILAKTCERAVAICEKQATEKGNCGSCK